MVYILGVHRERYTLDGVYPGCTIGCRYTLGGVYPGCICLGILGGVYPGVYLLLYHPGYTTVHTVRGVLPGTLSPSVMMRREEALGSTLWIIRE